MLSQHDISGDVSSLCVGFVQFIWGGRGYVDEGGGGVGKEGCKALLPFPPIGKNQTQKTARKLWSSHCTGREELSL